MLFIYGPIPKPTGGISIFILRLLPYLKKYNIRTFVIDPYPGVKVSTPPAHHIRLPIPLFGKFISITILVILSYLPSSKIFWNCSTLFGLFPLILMRKHSFTFLIHDGGQTRQLFDSLPNIVKYILLRIFSMSFVLHHNCQAHAVLFSSLHFDSVFLPVNIPPSPLPSLKSSLPELSPIVKVIGSGYCLEEYRHDLLVRLAYEFQDYQFVLCLYGLTDQKILSFLINAQNKIENLLILRNLSEIQFNNLLSESSVYIRTSSVDSWCIAHSDAYYMGLTVVASNVCLRIANTHLFESGSYSNLKLAFMSALQHYSSPSCAGRDFQIKEVNKHLHDFATKISS